ELNGPGEKIIAVARYDDPTVRGGELQLFLISEFVAAALIDARHVKPKRPRHGGNLRGDIGVEHEPIRKPRRRLLRHGSLFARYAWAQGSKWHFLPDTLRSPCLVERDPTVDLLGVTAVIGQGRP